MGASTTKAQELGCKNSLLSSPRKWQIAWLLLRLAPEFSSDKAEARRPTQAAMDPCTPWWYAVLMACATRQG